MKVVCHCCEPNAGLTPLDVQNRPSLSVIAYRIGTYSSFRESMLTRIAAAPELAGLTTRRDDDYSITLLDLWAAVADVLTFYQERYANEAFLRTATFRDDIQRITNLIGYRLRPGVAAQTMLAFTLDAGKALTIPAGQKVQSVPNNGEQPQTFESIAPVAADARFNRLRIFPAPSPYAPLGVGTVSALLDRLQGPALLASFAAGDRIVLFTSGSSNPQEEKKIQSLVAKDDVVTLQWTEPIRVSASSAIKFNRTFQVFGHNHPVTYTEAFLPDPSAPDRVRWRIVNLASGDFATAAGSSISLDGTHKDLQVGQRLLVADTSATGIKTLVTIQNVRQANTQFKTFAESVTVLDVAPAVPASADRRNVVVYELEGPSLVFATQRYGTSFTADAVYLPGVCRTDSDGPAIEINRTIERNAFKTGVTVHAAELEKKRNLILTDAKGKTIPATIRNTPALSPATATPGQFCHLVIQLDFEGSLAIAADSSVLLGNVAPASHGETVRNEILGNGDASQSFQRFALRKSPLTYLPAPTEEGMASTLSLLVNGTRWTETPELYGQPPTARVFEVLPGDQGATTLQFGDGVSGARLPTGPSNLVATYRVGSGLTGRVAAGSLTNLLEKPAGLSAATNPLAAEGGADAESLDQARTNAPRTVRTFGRIVSLDDFADQVTASGEVAKARATWVYDGLDLGVHLTVAGQLGALFSAQALRDMGLNLKAVRDPNHRLAIANYTPVYVTFRVGVGIDPAYDSDAVVEAVRQAALDYFDFDNRSLGEAVALSDLYRVVQDVPGVVFADVDELLFKKPAGMSNFAFLLYLLARGATILPTLQPKAAQDRLRIFPARPSPTSAGIVIPAELAAIQNPADDVTVTVRGV
jgi:uncharacterized phage protein gp47/JayE